MTSNGNGAPPPSPATPSTATPSTATPSTATPSTATPSTATPSTATPSTATPSIAPNISLFRSVGPVLARDVILPYAVYYIVHRLGVANVPALAAGGAVNAFFTIAGLVRKRRVEVMALVILITFALGIAASFVTGNARFALAKDSVITGGVGITFLVSLLAARPVMFLMIRQMISHGDPAKASALDAHWDASPDFRSAQRLMTVVWGSGLVAEAIIRVIVISIVPVSTGAAASTALLLATFVLLIAWTRLYLPHRWAGRRRPEPTSGGS